MSSGKFMIIYESLWFIILHVDTSSFALKSNLASLKSKVDKLDNDKLKSLPNNSINLKNKVDKLDIDKLVPVPDNLSKLSNVVKNDVVKKIEYNAKIKKILKIKYFILLTYLLT